MGEHMTPQVAADKARLRWEKAREAARTGAEEALRSFITSDYLVYDAGEGESDTPCDAETLEKRIDWHRKLLFPDGGAPPYWWWSVIVGARALVAMTDTSHAGNSAAEFVGKATGMIQTGNAPIQGVQGVTLSISEGALERLQDILGYIKAPEPAEIVDVTPIETEEIDPEFDIPF